MTNTNTIDTKANTKANTIDTKANTKANTKAKKPDYKSMTNTEKYDLVENAKALTKGIKQDFSQSDRQKTKIFSEYAIVRLYYIRKLADIRNTFTDMDKRKDEKSKADALYKAYTVKVYDKLKFEDLYALYKAQQVTALEKALKTWCTEFLGISASKSLVLGLFEACGIQSTSNATASRTNASAKVKTLQAFEKDFIAYVTQVLLEKHAIRPDIIEKEYFNTKANTKANTK